MRLLFSLSFSANVGVAGVASAGDCLLPTRASTLIPVSTAAATPCGAASAGADGGVKVGERDSDGEEDGEESGKFSSR